MLITMVLFGFLTQSRTFILSLSIIIFLLLLASKNFNIIQKFTFTVLISLIYFLSTKVSYLSNIVNLVILRIIEPRGDDISGGRKFLWNEYYDLLTSGIDTFFLGLGPNVMQEYELTQVAHNAILEDLLSFGFIGSVLIITLFYSHYLYFKRYFRLSIYGIIPLVVIVVNGMFGHSFLSMASIVQFSIFLMFNIYQFQRSQTFYNTI